MDKGELKNKVKNFWEESSCGESLYLKELSKEGFLKQMNERYKLEPYIIEFAKFDNAKGKRVLEIGVGLGADHQKFAEAEADLYGIDLTHRSIMYTKHRMELFGLKSKLAIADAENLPFEDNCFDIVYSWGVLHHTPNTQKAVDEIYRVLKEGG